MPVRKRKKRRPPRGVPCPFCGEREEIFVDEAGGDHQTYVEDCPVCCRPRVVHVERDEVTGERVVWLERDQ
jgi:hypothetical protein